LSFVSDMCDISLTVGGCLMCFFIRYRWKMNNLNEELTLGNPSFMGSFIQKYINFTISWVCPIVLSILSVLVIIDKFFGL
ncbi:MAG: hypothetical protein ACK55U_17850, partial [Bacteroidota bacterium]